MPIMQTRMSIGMLRNEKRTTPPRNKAITTCPTINIVLIETHD